nr:MAG TPA: hypothetical protein [Caudoviricetes sp.]
MQSTKQPACGAALTEEPTLPVAIYLYKCRGMPSTYISVGLYYLRCLCHRCR